MLKRGGVLSICILMIFAAFAGCTSTEKTPDELDLSKYPFYREDFADMQYAFGDDETITPYWKGNIIYNESIMPIDYGTEISAKLEYTPLKIISVRDYTLTKEYKEGEDYTVSGNKIVVLSDSQIPRLTEDNIKGKNIPEPYRLVTSISNIETDYMLMGANVIYTEGSLIYGHQLFVTYAYDVRELKADTLPKFQGDNLSKTLALLKGKEELNISIIGDSVGEGCSSSKFFDREPYMDNFITLASNGLSDYYETEINLTNLSLGGMKSGWGNTQINAIVDSEPDILFIHFGINDCGDMVSANMFADNIESIIVSVRAQLPGCEFVLFNPFTPNPTAYDTDRLGSYVSRQNDLAEKHTGVAVIDLYSISTQMLKTKKYMDATGNGINHLNDYTARLYTMAIMNTFIDY